MNTIPVSSFLASLNKTVWLGLHLGSFVLKGPSKSNHFDITSYSHFYSKLYPDVHFPFARTAPKIGQSTLRSNESNSLPSPLESGRIHTEDQNSYDTLIVQVSSSQKCSFRKVLLLERFRDESSSFQALFNHTNPSKDTQAWWHWLNTRNPLRTFKRAC